MNTTDKELMDSIIEMRNKKQSKPFVTTKTGKVFFKAITTITKPISEVNTEMNIALTNPKLWTERRYQRQAMKLYEKATSIKNNKQDSAQNMATKIAMFLHRYETVMNCEISSNLLKKEMDRLRSDHSKLRKQQMEERIAEILLANNVNLS